MKVVRAKDEKGATMPAPFVRSIKILFAPDKEQVPEIMLSAVEIPPGGHTDYHDHDRPELICVREIVEDGPAGCDCARCVAERRH